MRGLLGIKYTLVNTGEIVKVESQWLTSRGHSLSHAADIVTTGFSFSWRASSQTLSVGTSLPTVQTNLQSGNEITLDVYWTIVQKQIKYFRIQLEQFISISLGGIIIVSITEYGNGSEEVRGRRLSILPAIASDPRDLVKNKW